jgi:uncharacterized protein (DUF2141 family)
MNNNIYHLLILLGLFFTSCANQTSPTGGPKDTIPPSLVNSIPLDQTINYSGNEVSLTFDEFIKLNNARQQIIITPRLDQEITYTYRKNKAFIEFSEPLDPNTTYSINFREGIQDITENNPARLKLAFSTGSYIDSLQISGIVYDVLKGEPLENILVCLQEPVDTTNYFLQPPQYFTRSAKDGTFLFTNLKVANYHLYAFNDVNNDLKLQPTRERHGFISELVNLQSDTSGFEIPLVNNNTDTLKLISARQAGRYFEVNFNKYITKYNVDFTRENLPYMLADDHKTIRFFNLTTINNSLPANIAAEDSIEYKVRSEVDITYAESVRNPYDFTMTTGDLRIVKSNPQINTKVTFNKPIRSVLHDSIYVFVDSLNILPLTEENYTFNKSGTVMDLSYPLSRELYQEPEPTEDAPVSRRSKPATYIHFGRGAFLSVENDSSKQQKLTAKMFNDDQLGVLLINVDVPFENFIVELLNNRNEVIERRYSEQQIRFSNLTPATYFIRILEDSDSDRFWDVGNIFTNTPPEEVIHYINPENKKDIIIRANWEVGPFTISW